MEFLVELIGEVFFEGITEIIKNKKISKWIRYPILFVMSFVYFFLMLVFGGLAFQLLMAKQILGGLIMLILFLIFLILIIHFVKKI